MPCYQIVRLFSIATGPAQGPAEPPWSGGISIERARCRIGLMIAMLSRNDIATLGSIATTHKTGKRLGIKYTGIRITQTNAILAKIMCRALTDSTGTQIHTDRICIRIGPITRSVILTGNATRDRTLCHMTLLGITGCHKTLMLYGDPLRWGCGGMRCQPEVPTKHACLGCHSLLVEADDPLQQRAERIRIALVAKEGRPLAVPSGVTANRTRLRKPRTVQVRGRHNQTVVPASSSVPSSAAACRQESAAGLATTLLCAVASIHRIAYRATPRSVAIAPLARTHESGISGQTDWWCCPSSKQWVLSPHRNCVQGKSSFQNLAWAKGRWCSAT